MSALERKCHKILEEKGGEIADKARSILLEEESLSDLLIPLRYISEHWRDPLTPSLVVISFEAVGGRRDDSQYKAALALTLMSLSFNLWDDLLDKTARKGFVPTILGKFGEGVDLIIGGLASAKAFSILNEMNAKEAERQEATKLVWDYWQKLAIAEMANLSLRRGAIAKPEERLRVIEMQAVNLETSSKIGALLGNGSDGEIEHLGNYGRHLSTILELRKDFAASINLTLELAEKIRNNSLPYTLLWAMDNSKRIKEYVEFSEIDNPVNIRRIVENLLKTKVSDHLAELLKRLTKRAELELSNIPNRQPTRKLRFFLRAQSRLFEESLSMLGS